MLKQNVALCSQNIYHSIYISDIVPSLKLSL